MSPESPPFHPSESRPPVGHGARFVVAIDESSVGERVSIRYLLRGDSPTAEDVLMTDIVGHLQSWTTTTVVVSKRDGELVTINRASIVAAKVVPPQPPRKTGRA